MISVTQGSLLHRFGYRLVLAALCWLLIGPSHSQQPSAASTLSGIEVVDITAADANRNGWIAPRGAKARSVKKGSPADRAGIAINDIIVSVDGREVSNAIAFRDAVSNSPPGSQLQLRLLRARKERLVTLVVASPSPPQPKPVPQATAARGASKDLSKRSLVVAVETGGHRNLVRHLLFTPDGKEIVSAGDDKVVRVWNVATGKTERIIRGEVGAGREGQVFSVALSPDGAWLAVAGWMTSAEHPGHHIRLYDYRTGGLMGLFVGHQERVSSVAFSSDGHYLISGAHDNTAIIWNATTRQSLHVLKGHKAEVLAVAFAPGDRAVTGSYDGTLKLWRVSDGAEIATLTGHRGMVETLAVNPRDGSIASGSRVGELMLWDSKSGSLRKALETQQNVIGRLRFGPDGNTLLTTAGEGSLFMQKIWDVETGQVLATYKGHDNSVSAADISPDQRLVATGGGKDSEIHVWDIKTGKVASNAAGAPLILRGLSAPVFATGWLPEAGAILWGAISDYATHNDRGALTHRFRLPTATGKMREPERLSVEAALDARRAQDTHGSLTIVHSPGGPYGHDAVLTIARNGKAIAQMTRDQSSGYGHLAYTFTPDGQRVISGGSNGHLLAYDLTGALVGRFVGHEGAVWSVACSSDGRLLISGGGDQTVRIWNLSSYELIATLLQGRDEEWVMWTPQGYYAGSPGADKLVGWQINRGPDQAADFVGAEQLRQHLNRPDIVERALILASAEQAVRDSLGTSFSLADLLARSVPKFRILAPSAGAIQTGGRTAVKIAIEATPDPIKAIRVQINGRQIDELTPALASGGFHAGEETLDLPLAAGRNDVRIVLTNAIGEQAETVTVMHQGEGDLDRRGTLYILAIGVDKYPDLGNKCGPRGDMSCDLGYSSADARELADTIEKRVGPSHSNVVKRLLINDASDPHDLPTATNIVDAIGQLQQTLETDTIVVSIAGHGHNEGPNYRFLATNAAWERGFLRGSTVVPWHALQEAIESAKGRRFLFVDTCHSANAYNARLGNAAYHANIIAYAAATFDQEALEDPALGHGLFTYAVVEGLEGKAALRTKGQISSKDLADYVTKRVDDLARAMNARQDPQYFKGRDAEDYVLTRF